jgi:hypothetical protein
VSFICIIETPFRDQSIDTKDDYCA